MTGLVQRFGPLAVMLLVAVASFWLLRELDEQRSGEGDRVAHVPDMYMENFVTTVMDVQGRPQRRLEAEYMAHFPDTDTHELQRPYMIMYRDQEQPPWHVRSDRGWVSASGDVLLLLGKVHIWRNNANDINALDIKTEDLRVLPDKEYGETDRPVVITTPTTQTRGVGMKAYLKESRLELLSKVHTRHEPTTN